MATKRDYFPGNNTPLGFFSYYGFILNQREAKKIYCIKGGPGTGKSTFMKSIGEYFLEKGEDVDFLHCSADENSLDGVVLTQRKIALIDGTSPHITDPLTPGAVDKIINLGEFWNDEALKDAKESLLKINGETSRWYGFGYKYLRAAKEVYEIIEDVYRKNVMPGEIYRLAAGVVYEEFYNLDVTILQGSVKKFFATAITPGGIASYIPSILTNMKKIYMIDMPVCFDNSLFMQTIADSAVFRGLDVELYYCPMSPDKKIEHIVIPQLNLAFLTTNKYHDILPWEVPVNLDGEDFRQEIMLLDMSDYLDHIAIEKKGAFIEESYTQMDILINKAIKCLEKAKSYHDLSEQLYIPNMCFTKINRLKDQIIEEIEEEINKMTM